MTFFYQKFFSLGCQNLILKTSYTGEPGRPHEAPSQAVYMNQSLKLGPQTFFP